MREDRALGASRRHVLRWAADAPAGAALAQIRMAARAATESAIRGQQGKQITLKFGFSQPTHTQNAHSFSSTSSSRN